MTGLSLSPRTIGCLEPTFLGRKVGPCQLNLKARADYVGLFQLMKAASLSFIPQKLPADNAWKNTSYLWRLGDERARVRALWRVHETLGS